MKGSILIIIISALLTSCCLFTSKDCGCKHSKPYLAESSKEWIFPFKSEELIFVNSDSITLELSIFKDFRQGEECIGGDECCTDYPTLIAEYTFGINDRRNVLVTTTALKNNVTFNSKKSSSSFEYNLGRYDVNTNKFSKPDNINILQEDTIVNDLKLQKVTFIKTDTTESEILIKSIVFIKGIGVIAFTDTSGITWNKK
jgi:hypothetical protein